MCPSLRYIYLCGECCWLFLLLLAQLFYLVTSLVVLTISVGRFWSVQSVLEFSVIKKNLRIMSDIERVFWTVLFRMASLVFEFFTPSDSSLVRNWLVWREPRTPVVKLVWEAFQPLFSRWLRWLMKPRRGPYLSFFSCSFLSAQSSIVSMALVYSRSTHNCFPYRRPDRPVFGL